MSRVNGKASRQEVTGLTPDEWDRKNIQRLIEIYDETFPYPHVLSIKFQMDDARKTVEIDKRVATTKNNLGLSKAMSIPTPLHSQLKKGYPAIFSDPKQTRWFLRHFPIFDLSK